MTFNIYGLVFLIVAIAMVLLLQRHWAALPFLGAACFMTLGQQIKVGPFHFTVIRLLVAVGLVRLFLRGERLSGGINGLDWLMLVWSVWALLSSFFHKVPSEALVYRLGIVYNVCGVYFLLRLFCQSQSDVVLLFKIICIVLLPIAAEMFYEKIFAHNLFSIFGGVNESPLIRMGTIRSQGPFAHPILAGTIGAVNLPLMISLWQKHKKFAIAGISACVIMVIASGSSGPVMSAVAAIAAMAMWLFRKKMRFVRRLVIFSYVGLAMVMNAPVYFLLARIDISGGSTGWHRAQLIQSAFSHLSEWWLAGTDYTRHWMPTGVYWSKDHTDITNHYLSLGVLGGLPLILLFIAILVKGFSFVGQILRRDSSFSQGFDFKIWALGAALFAHAATFISVSYFDQSFVFLYLILAGIGSSWAMKESTVSAG